MNFTEVITLISQVRTTDEIGNIINTETEKEVYARKSTLGTKEFYNAVAVGLTPTAEFIVRSCEYNGETECIYNGVRLTVIRALQKDRRNVVLVVGNKMEDNISASD